MRKTHLLFIFCGALIIVTSVGANIYLASVVMAISKAPPAIDEAQQTLKKVGELVELPEGKTPTIATVQDPEVLKKQGLFPTSQTGDVVLVYPEEKRAILYRPSTNKIIDISPVNITEDPPKDTTQTTNQAPAPAPAPSPEPTPAPTPAPVTP